jgi:putative DNA primase/helicase
MEHQETAQQHSGNPEHEGLSTFGTTPRPTTPVGDVPLHVLADLAWSTLMKANDPVHPQVLVRGRNLAYVASDGRGGLALDEHNRATLRDRLSETGRYVKVSAKGAETEVYPPNDIADTLLERDPSKYQGAPQVDRVVSVPVFAPDGSLINEPGYHRTARVYYRPVSGLEELPPVTGDMVDRHEAVDWIRNELFAEFPFVEPADFANAVALFLLPFARDLIEGLTPMHAALAPSPGSGKDALVDTALRPSCGTVPKTAEIKSDDEMRKQITAHLLAGSSALVFDNIKTGLDSGALAAALTADVWRDRVLQHSKSVLLPIRNVWALTANNLRTTSEQARRMVPIFLDAQMERPDKRQFSRDLDTWIPRNRAMAVWAALTLIESWRTAERPEFFNSYTGEFQLPLGTRILNSYSSWSRVMGGILLNAEITGFLENHDKMFTYADDEDADLAVFLAEWHAAEPEPRSVPELVTRLWSLTSDPDRPLSNNGLWSSLPPKLRDARDNERSGALGSLLQHNQDRVFGNHKVIKHAGRPKRWQVVKLG